MSQLASATVSVRYRTGLKRRAVRKLLAGKQGILELAKKTAAKGIFAATGFRVQPYFALCLYT
jgi:hypothetical protein